MRHTSLFIVLLAVCSLVSCTAGGVSSQPGAGGADGSVGRALRGGRVAIFPLIPIGEGFSLDVLETPSGGESTPGGVIAAAIYDELLVVVKSVTIAAYEVSRKELVVIALVGEVIGYRHAVSLACFATGSDYALLGRVLRYEERVGGSAGISSPASLAFRVELMDCGSRATLWERQYTDTQRSLFENLLDLGKFFKRGGRWVTVRELALEGAVAIARDLGRSLDTGESGIVE